jgi:hypothetical protein
MYPRCGSFIIYAQFKMGCVEDSTDQLTTYFETEDAIKVTDSAHNNFQHVQKPVLQKTLYRDAVTYAKLWSKRVASPEARPIRRSQHQ